MAIRLSVRPSSGGEETHLDFDQARVRIGRGASCDVRLPDPAVSGIHAMVLLDKDRYYVVDPGSTNGTRVGGELLVRERRKLLRSGDVIAAGPFEVRFQAGVGVRAPQSQDRTAAAARHLAQQVMAEGGLELRQPALVVLSGPQQGERFALPPAPASLVVGRATECDVVLIDGEVSRRQAELAVTAEGVTVQDLGGKNAVRVNDREVSRARLHDGDELLVGSTVLVLDEPVEAFLREMAERPDSRADRSPGPPSASARAGEPDGRQGSGAPSLTPATAGVPTSPTPAPERGEASESAPEAARSAELEVGDAAATGGPAEAASPAVGEALVPRAVRRVSTGTELAVLLVGALALAACVAALVWLFR